MGILKKMAAIFAACALMAGAVSGCSKDEEDSKAQGGTEVEVTANKADEIVAEYMDAMVNGDGETIVKLMSKPNLDYVLGMMFDGDEAALIEFLNTTMSMTGGVDWEIANTEELTDDEISEIADSYMTMYEAEVEIEEAVKYDVDLTVSVEDETQVQSVPLVVGKVDGKWCVVE